MNDQNKILISPANTKLDCFNMACLRSTRTVCIDSIPFKESRQFFNESLHKLDTDGPGRLVSLSAITGEVNKLQKIF